ncbi:MAG: hypothetical protein JWM86_578, partial [Thermoleophilia bacterium]|nr:hypothetical protein [Thermoleophilia bacterium]
ITLLVAMALALLAIAPAMAVGADGAPDEMVDPAAAMEPELSDNAEAAPVVHGGDADATAAATGGTVTVDGSGLEPGAPDGPNTGNSSGSSVRAGGSDAVAVGSLPFTGPGDGQIAMLLLVGSLMLAGGATAWTLARVAAPAR